MATVGTNQRQAKLVLLGDMGAGKSSLVLRFTKGQFFDYQVLHPIFTSVFCGIVYSTVSALPFRIYNWCSIPHTNFGVNDTTIKFEIWDMAGQERYHSLAPMYYRGAAAAIIVYDMSNAESFARAKKWVAELQSQGNSNLVMALAGNKADLDAKRSISQEDAQAYADENGLFLMETSAKTGQNVNELFYEIAKRLPKLQPAAKAAGISFSDRAIPATSKSSMCCT